MPYTTYEASNYFLVCAWSTPIISGWRRLLANLLNISVFQVYTSASLKGLAQAKIIKKIGDFISGS